MFSKGDLIIPHGSLKQAGGSFVLPVEVSILKGRRLSDFAYKTRRSHATCSYWILPWRCTSFDSGHQECTIFKGLDSLAAEPSM